MSVRSIRDGRGLRDRLGGVALGLAVAVLIVAGLVAVLKGTVLVAAAGLLVVEWVLATVLTLAERAAETVTARAEATRTGPVFVVGDWVPGGGWAR